jgi:predicted nucleic acid-binding protein
MKILLDLDIVVNALWKGKNKEAAVKFLNKLKKEDTFEIYTPYSLLQRVLNWKNKKLAAKIFNFYSIHSDRILSWKEVRKNLSGVNYKAVIKLLTKSSVKREDAVLILIASVFELGIETFNKKHLYSKQYEINNILKSFGLKEVEINVPI